MLYKIGSKGRASLDVDAVSNNAPCTYFENVRASIQLYYYQLVLPGSKFANFVADPALNASIVRVEERARFQF